jgi:hypothetical protein
VGNEGAARARGTFITGTKKRSKKGKKGKKSKKAVPLLAIFALLAFFAFSSFSLRHMILKMCPDIG